jgi:hypothetical protein
VPAAAPGAAYAHRKGGAYNWIDVFEQEDARLPKMVLYVSHADSTWWLRPLEEFLDGRFTHLEAPSTGVREAGLAPIFCTQKILAGNDREKVASLLPEPDLRALTPRQRRLIAEIAGRESSWSQAAQAEMRRHEFAMCRPMARKGFIRFSLGNASLTLRGFSAATALAAARKARCRS